MSLSFYFQIGMLKEALGNGPQVEEGQPWGEVVLLGRRTISAPGSTVVDFKVKKCPLRETAALTRLWPGQLIQSLPPVALSPATQGITLDISQRLLAL